MQMVFLKSVSLIPDVKQASFKKAMLKRPVTLFDPMHGEWNSMYKLVKYKGPDLSF